VLELCQLLNFNLLIKTCDLNQILSRISRELFYNETTPHNFEVIFNALIKEMK